MTRSRLHSTLLRLVLPGAVLGLAACSFSFSSGSRPAGEGKPATGSEQADPASSPGKPVGKPAEESPAEESPVEEPPVEEPPTPTSGNTELVASSTAVCRIKDATLAELCHRVLDPVAADDVDAWASVLSENVVLTRRTFEAGTQRLDGVGAVRKMAAKSGGLRALLNVKASDRVVGTVANDCRDCRRSFVTLEFNTRTGTTELFVNTTQPSMVTTVNVGSNLRREPLPEANRPTLQPKPSKPATVVKPATKGGATLQAPKQTKDAG